MKNIKNFQLVEATQAQLKAFENSEGDIPLFLKSESGFDWYECQKLFADDTIKIMYDKDDVIRSVVDAPVPQRGNTLAVSMFFPLDMSVAEIEGPLPDGFEIDSGSWKFDGVAVYRDEALVSERTTAYNENRRNYLAGIAATNVAMLQAGIDQNRDREGDAGVLAEWQTYLCNLRDMTPEQLQLSPAPFPDTPAPII